MRSGVTTFWSFIGCYGAPVTCSGSFVNTAGRLAFSKS